MHKVEQCTNSEIKVVFAESGSFPNEVKWASEPRIDLKIIAVPLEFLDSKGLALIDYDNHLTYIDNFLNRLSLPVEFLNAFCVTNQLQALDILTKVGKVINVLTGIPTIIEGKMKYSEKVTVKTYYFDFTRFLDTGFLKEWIESKNITSDGFIDFLNLNNISLNESFLYTANFINVPLNDVKYIDPAIIEYHEALATDSKYSRLIEQDELTPQILARYSYKSLKGLVDKEIPIMSLQGTYGERIEFIRKWIKSVFKMKIEAICTNPIWVKFCTDRFNVTSFLKGVDYDILKGFFSLMETPSYVFTFMAPTEKLASSIRYFYNHVICFSPNDDLLKIELLMAYIKSTQWFDDSTTTHLYDKPIVVHHHTLVYNGVQRGDLSSWLLSSAHHSEYFDFLLSDSKAIRAKAIDIYMKHMSVKYPKEVLEEPFDLVCDVMNDFDSADVDSIFTRLRTGMDLLEYGSKFNNCAFSKLELAKVDGTAIYIFNKCSKPVMVELRGSVNWSSQRQSIDLIEAKYPNNVDLISIDIALLKSELNAILSVLDIDLYTCRQ